MDGEDSDGEGGDELQLLACSVHETSRRRGRRLLAAAHRQCREEAEAEAEHMLHLRREREELERQLTAMLGGQGQQQDRASPGQRATQEGTAAAAAADVAAAAAARHLSVEAGLSHGVGLPRRPGPRGRQVKQREARMEPSASEQVRRGPRG